VNECDTIGIGRFSVCIIKSMPKIGVKFMILKEILKIFGSTFRFLHSNLTENYCPDSMQHFLTQFKGLKGEFLFLLRKKLAARQKPEKFQK
jgi:hypothetical protein